MTHDHDNLRAALALVDETARPMTGCGWASRPGGSGSGAALPRGSLLVRSDARNARRRRTAGGTRQGPDRRCGIAYWQNDYDTALRWYREAEDIVRGLGDRAWLADALYNTGETAALSGDMATVAAKLGEEGVDKD